MKSFKRDKTRVNTGSELQKIRDGVPSGIQNIQNCDYEVAGSDAQISGISTGFVKSR